MLDIINLAVLYFSLIFVGYACGKSKALPEAGLAWMNFFLLYVSLPALLFVIMSKTPFVELNNPPFLIATTLATSSAFCCSDHPAAMGRYRRADGVIAAGCVRDARQNETWIEPGRLQC